MSEENINPKKGGRPPRDLDEKTLASICNDLVIKVPLTRALQRAGVDFKTWKKLEKKPEVAARIDKAMGEAAVFYAQAVARCCKPHERTITKTRTSTQFRYQEGYDEDGKKYRRPIPFEVTETETVTEMTPGDGKLALEALALTERKDFSKNVDITSGGQPMKAYYSVDTDAV